MAGVILLLRQLGIKWDTFDSSLQQDVIISESPIELKPTQIGIFLKLPKGKEKTSSGYLKYKNLKAFFPEEILFPADKGFEILATVDEKYPGIIKKKNAIFILPNFFKYIAEVSTISKYNKEFSCTFSFDCFREIFLGILEHCASLLNKPLIRIWYYPKFQYKNALCFTTDVDYKLEWDILKNLPTTTKRKPNRCLYKAINHLIAARYLNKFYYSSIWGKYYRLKRILAKFIDVKKFFSPLGEIYQHNIPITAFLRPAEYQLEENLKDPPEGTGRLSYKPSGLDFIETGLHFGATVGNILFWKHIKDSYKEDVFKTVKKQKNLLESEIKHELYGTRLHNESRFTPAIFNFIEKSGAIYDSSVFGGIVGDKLSPNGTSLPYWPILKKGDQWSQVKFIEIPVIAYEGDSVPLKHLEEFNLPIVVSKHPDSHNFALVSQILENNKKSWWKVHLWELARWWQERDAVDFSEVSDNTIRLSNLPKQGCVLVVNSRREIDILGAEAVNKYRDDFRNYYEIQK